MRFTNSCRVRASASDPRVESCSGLLIEPQSNFCKQPGFLFVKAIFFGNTRVGMRLGWDGFQHFVKDNDFEGRSSMKTRLLAIAAVCSLLFSIPMVAQDEPATDQGRLLEAVQRILELTDSQAQELANLRQSHLEQVHALWTQIRELEQQEKVAQIQQAVLLAPQGGPLAAFGLIHPPRPHHSFRRLLRQRFGRRFGQSSAMPGGEDHTAPGPVPFRLFPTN